LTFKEGKHSQFRLFKLKKCNLMTEKIELVLML